MGEVDDLYLYLPSSVVSVSEVANTISHYTTPLRAPISLAPGIDYEAALVKLIYPVTVQNCYDGYMEFYSYTFKRNVLTSVAAGFYLRPRDLLPAINKVLLADKKYYKVSINLTSRKFVINCEVPPNSEEQPYIKFSDNLQVLTGLPRYITDRGYTISKDSFDMTGGIQNIYCYCDLLKNVNIGDALAPIAAVVSYSPTSEAQAVYEATNPIYVPLKQTEFSEVTIELRTKTGAYVPFTSGEVMCIIHIRQKMPSL
jgi:hypothetical protein